MTPKQIVVIEDEPAIRRLISINLRARGIDVAAYETAEEGLAHMDTDCPDALILDLVLPGMTGVELLDTMQEINGLYAVPVVVVSASVHKLDAERDNFLNVRSVLLKPIAIADLLDAVNEALAS